MDITRFKDASWFSEASRLKVLIVGAGGIGSHLAFNVSRLNVAILTVIDYDSVDKENSAGQLLDFQQLGKSKVESLSSILNILNCNYINTINNKIITILPVNYISQFDIVISAVDNMTARKILFDSFIQEGVTTKYFMDGRLGPEHFHIFTINREEDTWDKYKEVLFDDSEIEPLACTYKQTTYIASMIGAVMSNIIVNICNKIQNPSVFRATPFQINYNSSLLKLF